MVRASVYYAASPGLNLAWCVFNMFSLADFFRQMVSKVHHLKILEFCSLFTGKKGVGKFPVHLPFALLPYGLFAGIIL